MLARSSLAFPNSNTFHHDEGVKCQLILRGTPHRASRIAHRSTRRNILITRFRSHSHHQKDREYAAVTASGLQHPAELPGTFAVSVLKQQAVAGYSAVYLNCFFFSPFQWTLTSPENRVAPPEEHPPVSWEVLCTLYHQSPLESGQVWST